MIDTFQREFHSRIPIYRDALDDVIGMVHIKDLLKYWGKGDQFRLDDIVREVMFVPPSMPVADLLLNMRTRRIHMALVIDEYGGTDGLVTIEDLVESIVGDIEDEHDEDEAELIAEGCRQHVLEVDGRAPSVDVEAKLHVDLLPAEQDEDVETIAGVVASLAGRVPQRGEVISHPHGVEFQVLQADARRIRRLRITKVAPVGPAADSGYVIARLAVAVGARRGLRRYGLAFVLGVLAAGGLEPLSFFPLLIIAFTGLVWLLRRGYRGTCTFHCWLAVRLRLLCHWPALDHRFPLLVDAGRFAWMVPFALALLPGGLGLLIGVATWTATWIVPEGGYRVLALAVAWAAVEWIRGHIFTGFPWNLLGYTWIDVAPCTAGGWAHGRIRPFTAYRFCGCCTGCPRTWTVGPKFGGAGGWRSGDLQCARGVRRAAASADANQRGCGATPHRPSEHPPKAEMGCR